MQALSKFFLHSSLSKIFGEFLESAKKFEGKKENLVASNDFPLENEIFCLHFGLLVGQVGQSSHSKTHGGTEGFHKG